MDIVVLNDFAYVDGGASKIALGSAKALSRRGHRVYLFTAVGPVAPDLLEIPELNVLCLQQHEVVDDPNPMRAMTRGLWNPTAEARFRSLLKSLSPGTTVVHLHTWTKALSASVVHVAAELGFRTVLTMHDYFSACPTGSFFIHPAQKICKLRPMSPACVCTQCDSRSYAHKLWRVSRQWIGNRIGGVPSSIQDFISISTLSEEVLRPELPANARFHRIPNFIELHKDPPVDVARNNPFAFAGRLSPEKGPMLLAECTSTLEFELLYVGDGPQRAEIQACAPNAFFTGWLPAHEVHERLRSARALVFPSVWYETQGLVVAEAAALGLPAIVPSTSAAREWVQDGVTGLIFKGGNVEDLREKIRVLRDDPETAAAMGQRAYESHWQSPCTTDLHCESLEALYLSMLSAHSNVGTLY